MEKHIMGENGISYTLGEDSLYYLDLYLPEETEYPIGKYGMLRKSYLKEHRKGLYLELRCVYETAYHYPVTAAIIIILTLFVIQMLLAIFIAKSVRKDSLIERIRFSE